MDELIIQKKDDKKLIILLESNKIVEYYEITDKTQSKIGNIYIGIITSVHPKTNTIFVDIGLSKQAFLELKSLDKKYKKGDKILVKVKKDETDTKGAKLTSNVNCKDFDLPDFEKIKKPRIIYLSNSLEEKILKDFKGKVYKDNEDYISKFGLETELEKVQNTKIWLKSGGFIVIEKTEALTAIDVNSGKTTGKRQDKKEDVVFKVNKEAAVEVMRQLRLKNIGGIIIIDFINMEKKEHEEEILEIIDKEKSKDHTKIANCGFTKLGLFEITRQKKLAI